LRLFPRTFFRLLRVLPVLVFLINPSIASGEKDRPNILLLIWSSVRADRTSLYGFPKETTPFLAGWAEEARVYENCVSTSNQTASAVASLFTGLLPGEHGARNGNERLDDRLDTLAELLGEAGYDTFLFSADPALSSEEGFGRGFGRVDHPWDPKWRGQAIGLTRKKRHPRDRSSELPLMIDERDFRPWNLKATGSLAPSVFREWVRERSKRKPLFGVMILMEARRPLLPPPAARRRVMTPDQVERSWEIDAGREFVWMYNAGFDDYDPADLEVAAGTYDAALSELDEIFRNLNSQLGRVGYVENKPDVSENTAVIVVADHGEHLGEHHLLDHQFSLHEPVLRVPLVVRYPPLFPPGRERRPVMNFDLFPTILELAGIEPPARREFGPVSLLRPAEERPRVSECLGLFRPPIDMVAGMRPAWDRTGWEGELRSLTLGGVKLIRASDGSAGLFRLADDPGEARNLYAPGDPVSDRYSALLDRSLSIRPADPPDPEGGAPDRPDE